ncbi:MAG: 50S ribosomal protein L21 [Candidatus Moraniibacteriota bacterium]|nr:MAG: 50S ribosomal protein L21 [Candidatus Moranbacteria bacterium]
MNYAIIRSGNKQHKVVAGKTIKVEKLATAEGSVIFDDVLLHVDGEKVEVGTPTVSGIKVYGTVMGVVKADKIQVFKYKHKSRYRKLRGHRQNYSVVKIESIGAAPVKVEKASTKAVKAEPKKAVVKKTTAKKAAPKKAAK